jgi:hypothetical protein
MERNANHTSAPGKPPATTEHKADKAIKRHDTNTASQWLGAAMDLWVQDEANTAMTRPTQTRGRNAR